MPQFKRLFFLCLLASLSFNLYAQQTACPPNIDFETGTLNGWACYTCTCCPINTPTFSGPTPGRHTLMSGTGVDPYGGFPVVPPGGGNFAFRLGNDTTGAEAERVRYFVKVPASSSQKYLLVFNYAVVLQDPNHAASEQPRFSVNGYDSATGDPIPCVQFNFVASSVLPGFTAGTNGTVYKPWSSVSVNLSSMAGKTVALDFATGDCDLGGHFGYAYIDMACGVYAVKSLLCNGSSSTIKLLGPEGFQTYKWYDATFTTFYGTGQNLVIAKPSTTTQFAVALTPYPGYGCPDTLYTSTALSDVTVHPSNDTTVCAGGTTIQIKAGAGGTSSPFTYSWTPTTGLSCTNCADPFATVTANTTYHITVTDSNGCPRYDSVRVSVKQPIGINITLPTDTVCQYDHIKIFNDASLNPNSPDVFHGWDLDSGVVLTGQNTDTITATWRVNGLRKVRLHVLDKPCTSSDSTYIYVKPGPLASFTIQPEVCLGDLVKLEPKEQANTNYYWTIDDFKIYDTTFVSPQYLSWYTLGKKNIHLKLMANNGCINTYDTAIRVHEYPTADIVASSLDVCNGDTISLSTPAGNHYIYEWAPRAFLLQDNLPTVSTIVHGDIKVWTKVTTQWGCSRTDTVDVTTQRCCNVYFPDAFTPNGDGRNDKFRVISAGNHTLHTFTVFNRWGKVIFDGKDINNGWDGTFNGVPQDIGTYYYYINYICNNGKTLEKSGNFILVR